MSGMTPLRPHWNTKLIGLQGGRSIVTEMNDAPLLGSGALGQPSSLTATKDSELVFPSLTSWHWHDGQACLGLETVTHPVEIKRGDQRQWYWHGAYPLTWKQIARVIWNGMECQGQHNSRVHSQVT